MMLTIAVLLAAAPSSGALQVADLERFHQELFERVAPTVVFISTGKAFGSGVLVSKGGLVLTNAHVVQGADRVDVVLQDGRKTHAVVVERPPRDIDLALLQLDLTNTPAAELAVGPSIHVGSWVAAIGHGEGAVWTFNVGMVSNIYSSASERPVFQTQIPLNPGNSGGPIIDRTGRVVGIVTAGIKEANSINFGIDVGVALRSLGRLAALCDCLTVSAPEGVAIFVDNKNVGTGRVVVPATAGPHTVFAVVNGVMQRRSLVFPESRVVELSPPGLSPLVVPDGGTTRTPLKR